MSTMARTAAFTARFGGAQAKDIISRDRARAQKFLQGLHPHGPTRTHEYRLKHHHGTRR